MVVTEGRKMDQNTVSKLLKHIYEEKHTHFWYMTKVTLQTKKDTVNKKCCDDCYLNGKSDSYLVAKINCKPVKDFNVKWPQKITTWERFFGFVGKWEFDK